MTWECLNCTNTVGNNEWFCCKACQEKYMKFQQCADARIDTDIETEVKLRQSEIFALTYLSNLGYELERCENIGYPDFRVKNKNVWFEIKTPCGGLNKNQIREFGTLLNNKHTIYIAYVDNEIVTIFNLQNG